MIKSSAPPTRAPARHRGFTMIEIIVVMTLVGLLLSLVLPHYFGAIERGKDKAIAYDLAQMREAIDHFYGDRAVYPDRLDDLVTYRYLRELPVNPVTGRVDWETIPPSNNKGQVFDVRAPGQEPDSATRAEPTPSTSPMPFSASGPTP